MSSFPPGSEFGGTPYGNGPLLLANDGYLYGTLYFGIDSDHGTVFKMSPSGDFRTLYQFDITHGIHAVGPLIQGSDGNFYGTTYQGGTAPGIDWSGGVIFKLTASGALTVLYNLNGLGDGGHPVGGLVQATDGNIYGTTSIGGPENHGLLFRITPNGGFTVLHDFDGPTTGAQPMVTLVQHTNGKLYGDTYAGGSTDGGVFFSLDIGAGPFVRLLPEAGNVGSTIEILGQGFTGASAVSFNGTPAAFVVSSDTFLTATVPAGATSGFVTVTTLSGTLTSNKSFRVGLPTVNAEPADIKVLLTPYPTPPVQGGLLTYAFKVWNLGPGNAFHEVLKTRVPQGATFSGISMSGTPGLGTCTHPPIGSSGSVICTQGGRMAPNTTWTVRMTVKVTASAGTVITESATATEDNTDPNLTNNTITVRNTVH